MNTGTDSAKCLFQKIANRVIFNNTGDVISIAFSRIVVYA
jgi:hypothetical protein